MQKQLAALKPGERHWYAVVRTYTTLRGITLPTASEGKMTYSFLVEDETDFAKGNSISKSTTFQEMKGKEETASKTIETKSTSVAEAETPTTTSATEQAAQSAAAVRTRLVIYSDAMSALADVLLFVAHTQGRRFLLAGGWVVGQQKIQLPSTAILCPLYTPVRGLTILPKTRRGRNPTSQATKHKEARATEHVIRVMISAVRIPVGFSSLTDDRCPWYWACSSAKCNNKKVDLDPNELEEWHTYLNDFASNRQEEDTRRTGQQSGVACRRCKKSNVRPLPRYNVAFQCCDVSGSQWVRAFEPIAQQLLGNVTCAEMATLYARGCCTQQTEEEDRKKAQVEFLKLFDALVFSERLFQVRTQPSEVLDRQGQKAVRWNITLTQVLTLNYATEVRSLAHLVQFQDAQNLK